MTKKLLLTAILLISQSLFAAPTDEKTAICYVFKSEKLKSRLPCILSSGYGAGGTYEVAQIGKKKYVAVTSTCYDEKLDDYLECGTTLNGKEAIYYHRDLFYSVITDSSMIDDRAITCYATKDKKIDICFK